MTLTWKCEDAEHGFQKNGNRELGGPGKKQSLLQDLANKKRSNYTQIRGSLSKRK
jgi:hypothetical protein